jgi:hydroxycarboxylate dehydrogenase B
MKTIDHLSLHALTVRILRAGGSDATEAQTVADHLVEANLSGHDSHGVGMLPTYCKNLEAGTLLANQTPAIVQASDNFAVWDGRSGFGQKIARDAMGWAIEAARTQGVAVHGLRNTHHIGRIGAYGEIVAKAGLVSLHFVNVNSGPPPVAPFAGREGRFITNPVCIAIPGTATTAPVILDFATSRIAMGKVRVAHNEGKPVIAGALLDVDGRPTTDASVMYSDPRGVVLPFGEHKGSGLALICELLAGAIVGAGTLRTATPPEQGIKNAMLTIVLDPTRLASRAFIETEIDSLIAWVKSADPLDPAVPVLVAGEPERLKWAERLAKGIPIDDTTWTQICDAAARLHVPIDPV